MKAAIAQWLPWPAIRISIATGSSAPATSPVLIPSQRPPPRKSIARAETCTMPSIEPNAIASGADNPCAFRSSTSTALKPKLTNAFSAIAATTRKNVLLAGGGAADRCDDGAASASSTARRGSPNL